MLNLNSSKFKQYQAKKSFDSYDTLLSFLIFVGIFGLILYILLISNLFSSYQNLVLILSFLFIISGLVSVVLKFFNVYGLRDISSNKSLSHALEYNENLIDFCDYHCLNAIDLGIGFARDKKLSTFNSLILIIGLAFSKRGQFILARLGYDFNRFNDYFYEFISTIQKGELNYIDKTTNKAFQLAAKRAIDDERNQIEIGDLFYGASQADDFSKKIIFDLNLKTEDLENVIDWEKHIHDAIENEKKFWERYLKERTGGIGADWAAGWTPYLLMFARPVQSSNIFSTYFNSPHKDDIDNLERILSRNGKNNALLVGPPGIGKKTIVYGLADKIVRGQSLDALKNKHVYVLDVNRIIANANPGEVENRLSLVLNDAVHAGNVVLFIDNLTTLISSGYNKFGSIDATSLLIPYLQSAKLQIIATLSQDDFHRNLEPNQALINIFEKIQINEPNPKQTVSILEENIGYIELKNQTFFTYESLKTIVELSDRYIKNKTFPAKAIDLANEAAIYATTHNIKTIQREHIENIIASKVKIPTTAINKEEKEKLVNLESILHKRVLGQETAIKAVSDALRRARTGLSAQNRPLGSFLFLGPTGVGKTETAKALADAYFGSEKEMIRLDMSEYQDPTAIYKLIGSPQGHPGTMEGGFLTKQVLDKPFSVILLDEVEKSNSDVLNLFLQILDDGRVTDNLGRVIDFTNTIIIATSNAGAEFIRQSIKEGKKQEELKNQLIEYLQKQHIFKPEFLNRFDGVITYEPLDMNLVVAITRLMIDKLTKDMFDKKQIKLVIGDRAIVKLAQIGFDPTLGARPLRRAIQDHVENKIAQKVLAGELEPGSELIINETDID